MLGAILGFILNVIKWFTQKPSWTTIEATKVGTDTQVISDDTSTINAQQKIIQTVENAPAPTKTNVVNELNNGTF